MGEGQGQRQMTRWLLTIAIVLGCQFVDNDGLARDPYTVGFPPCQGGEEGYPGIITATNRTTNQAETYLVLFAQPFADPAYVVCWYVHDSEHYAYTVHIHANTKARL